jgi:tRNA G18 (ribose-2'-O)-methylase SpoU
MVRIPMTGTVDSLNVACAASIVMYEIARRSRGDTVIAPGSPDAP